MTDQALVDQFKAGLDPDAAAAMADRITTAEARIAELEAARDAAESRADAAERDRDTVTASVTEREAAAKPRALRAIPDGKTLDREALVAAIADADDVAIAFSDGKQEIKGLGVRAIAGDAWKEHPTGLMLTQAVDLRGAAHGEAPYVVEGYALLLDGKPVAYTKHDPAITVPAGGHVRLENDIVF